MPKNKINYEGKSYNSLHALAEACQVDEKLLSGRLRNGWSVEEAVETGIRERSAVPVSYQGKTYPTMRDLADAVGINYDRLRSRLRTYGWSVEDAVEAERKCGKPVEYGGRVYPSIASLARESGIEYGRLRARLQRGWDLDKAIETEKVLLGAKPVTYQGQNYPSFQNLADTLELPVSTLLRKYADEGDTEKAVEQCRAVAKDNSVCLWGISYASLGALAEAMGINYHTLHPAVKGGEPLEDAVQRLMRTESIHFRDGEYACLTDLCAAYKIQPVNVQSRLRLGLPLTDALTLPIRPISHGCQVCYEGVEYPSRTALCRAYGISALVTDSLKRYLDASFLEIFHLLVELKERAGIPRGEQLNYIPACIFQGKTYKTVFLLCKDIGMDCAKLQNYKSGHGYSNLFDALRALQETQRPIYTIDGAVYTHSQMSKLYSGFEIMRREDCRSMVPAYPQLQNLDFTTGVDVLELKNELLRELFPPELAVTQSEGPQL